MMLFEFRIIKKSHMYTSTFSSHFFHYVIVKNLLNLSHHHHHPSVLLFHIKTQRNCVRKEMSLCLASSFLVCSLSVDERDMWKLHYISTITSSSSSCVCVCVCVIVVVDFEI
jgi:hypothetical protein